MEGKHIINEEFEYHTNDKLGAGAFGEVFKGKKISTGEIVAIKTIDKYRIKKYG